MIHFLAGIPRIIYLTAPLAFLIFHAYIIYAPALVILLYVLPHMVHAGLTNSMTQGAFLKTFWGEIYETVFSWYITLQNTFAVLASRTEIINIQKMGMLEQQHTLD